jgi:hypothetical protein
MVCRPPDEEGYGSIGFGDRDGNCREIGTSDFGFLQLVDFSGSKSVGDLTETSSLTQRPQMTALELRRARMARERRARAKRVERAVFGAAALFALLATTVGGFQMLSGPAQAPHAGSVVTVAEGDTLWGLADRYKGADMGTSVMVDAIRADNPTLSQGAPLTVGERIVMPAAR